MLIENLKISPKLSGHMVLAHDVDIIYWQNQKYSYLIHMYATVWFSNLEQYFQKVIIVWELLHTDLITIFGLSP